MNVFSRLLTVCRRHPHTNSRRACSGRATNRSRLLVESLEDRRVLSTLTVVPHGFPTDALHFRTDIWSSSVVILGLVALWLGEGGVMPKGR